MSDRFDELKKEERIELRVPQQAPSTADNEQTDHIHSTAKNEQADQIPPIGGKEKQDPAPPAEPFQPSNATPVTSVHGQPSVAQDSVRTTSSDASLAKRVPLKPKSKRIPFAFWLLLIPAFATIASLIFDPTSIYLFQKTLLYQSNQEKTAELLSSAINIRRDPELLSERASVYGYLHKFREQEKDLQELSDKGFKLQNTAYEMATVKANQGLYDDKVKQLLRKPIDMALRAQALPDDQISKEIPLYLTSSIFALTLAGDTKVAFAVDEQDDYSLGVKQLFEAIDARELGDSTKAKSLFNESIQNIENDYSWDKMPQYFLALMCLDKGDVHGAENIMNKITDSRNKKYKHYSDETEQLVNVWIDFAKGDMQKALDSSESLIDADDQGYLEFSGINRLAAMHYLRSLIYEKQGDKIKQKEEFQEYAKYRAAGKAYIPKLYRNSSAPRN